MVVDGLGSIGARFVFVVVEIDLLCLGGLKSVWFTELFVCIQFLGFIFFVLASRFDFDFRVSFSTSTTSQFHFVSPLRFDFDLI